MIVFNNNEAVYIQIAKKIIEQIYTNQIKQNEELDSVRTLSQVYKVTIRSVQNSLDYLEELGIVRKKMGVGVTVIATKADIEKLYEKYALEYAKDFLEKLKTIGLENEASSYVDKIRSLTNND